MSLPHLTPREVRARRLARHGLTRALADPTPAGAAAAMHAAHAQVMSAAEVSVAIRLPGSTRQTVREALADGSLTKTFGPRGTLHLVPTRDLALWVGALGNVPRGASSFPADVRLTEAQADEVVAAVGETLLEGQLTADELDAEVVARTGSWAGDLVMPAFQGFWPRWRQAVARCAHDGVLVFGADRGRKVTYTNPRRRDPDFAPAPPEVAEPWFVAGYLHAYGPATPADLARWNAAPLPWARALLDAAHHAGGRRRPRAAPSSTRATPHRSRSAGACGCCPTSTRSASASRRGRRCSPAAPGSARWPAPRPATTRCSWSTASCRVSGTSAVPDAGSRSRSRPGPTSAPARLRALDAQVARLGEILEGAIRG